MKVLILTEDFVKDEHVIQPIIEAMFKALNKPKTKVVVCKDPRFHGTSQALKWEWIRQALDRHRGMIDIFLLCVDRDGEQNRQTVLTALENQAAAEIGPSRAFFAENAWQEVEVWLLAGHTLPSEWDWKTIRNHRDPKEHYFVPFAQQRGVINLPAEGRGNLAREAAAKYDRIRQKCQEDVNRLHSRIESWIGERRSSNGA